MVENKKMLIKKLVMRSCADRYIDISNTLVVVSFSVQIGNGNFSGRWREDQGTTYLNYANDDWN